MRDLLMDDQAEAAILAVWAQHLRPAPVESIAAWADQFRQIAKGPEKGQWRTSRTPYLREPMACMSEGSGVERVVMQFATQLGKTEVLYNTILQRIHRSPMDMMIVQPTLSDSKDHSRERFMPTVRRMPEIAARLSKPSSRDESATWQTKSLAGGATLFFAGANSARSLASKPLGLVCCDEIDGYPMDVDGEGDPLTLVGERMSNYSDRKLLLCSTPTLRDFSRIEAEYLASDRRRYFVPCPHCGEFQHLEWGADKDYGIKWLKSEDGSARPETAVYVCRHCGASIEEHHKTGMLEEGEWRAENPGAQMGAVAGFHLNKLYSPVGWRSWRWMVSKWVEAMDAARSGDVTKLKSFINTSLAETFEEQGDRADEHELRRRAAEIPMRQVHWGLYVLTMGVDVQGDRLEAYLWAWGRGMERQLVDRAIFYGDPALPESEAGSPWAALTEYRRTPVLHASGRPVPILASAVDTGGHHTQAVYAYVRAHQHTQVLAIKGSSLSGKAVLGKPTEQDVNWRGQKMRKGVKLWPIGTDTAKAEIYGRLRNAEPGPGYVHFSRHTPAEVFEQLTSERLVTRYVKGHPRLEWVKPAGRRNEALDCAVYALAAAHYLHMDRWREGDWAKWESRVQTRDLFDAPAEPAPTMPPPPQQPERVSAPGNPQIGRRRGTLNSRGRT
ncbi:MAG: phage terminase large subunit family protein [Burkholderiaceae bacterium]|nr:phage terminase large subunit family protein [Burkholderiaceae bacterium]